MNNSTMTRSVCTVWRGVVCSLATIWPIPWDLDILGLKKKKLILKYIFEENLHLSKVATSFHGQNKCGILGK